MLRHDTLPPIPFPFVGSLPNPNRTTELLTSLPRPVYGPTVLLPVAGEGIQAAEPVEESAEVSEMTSTSADRFTDHPMTGVYAEMVLTDRPPLRSSDEVQRRWGVRATEVGDITLPFFHVPIDYRNPNWEEALAQAEKASAQRWGEHELVALQQEKAGHHGESEYIITTHAVLARVERMPRLQRTIFMHRSPEVKRLRNGEQLAIGRGQTEAGASRWLPAGVPESEPYGESHTMRRRAIRDDEGLFTVSKEGVLSYTGRGFNPARFTGHAFPEETAYNAALDAHKKAVSKGEAAQVKDLRRVLDAYEEILPARRRRLASPNVSLNLALGRLIAADEAQQTEAGEEKRPVYNGDTNADLPAIPAQRTSPENHPTSHHTNHS